MASGFDRFTERARRVLTLAQEEAQRLNHNYIGTEHLLLGLVGEKEGVAARVLQDIGLDSEQVRKAVERMVGRGRRPIVRQTGLTSRAKRVIELAVDEARWMGHHHIGSEHLLLGLVREAEGIAVDILQDMGVGLEAVRAETMRVIRQADPGRSPGQEYLLKHSREFSEKYPGKCVAIVGHGLASVAENRVEAYREAKKKHPEQEVLVVYVPTPEELVTLL